MKEQHSNLHKKVNILLFKSIDFLHALFYMNFTNLNEVLQRMDSSYLKIL